jgi:hypothetical protein
MFYGLEKEELESNLNINEDNNQIIMDININNDIDNFQKKIMMKILLKKMIIIFIILMNLNLKQKNVQT